MGGRNQAVATLIFAILVVVLLAGFFIADLRTSPKRQAEALYLVERVGSRYGLELTKRPLALEIPWSHEGAVVHYHLLRTGGERDSITLVARRGGKSRLGNLAISNDPARLFSAGLTYLFLGAPPLDRSFRIFTEPDRRVLLLNLLEDSGDLLRVLQDLACRTRSGRFELIDLDGHVKMQVHDKSLRFPSDVEKVTLDLVRLYQLYLVLAGVSDLRDVPAIASPVTP